jgi:hypothetical protein
MSQGLPDSDVGEHDDAAASIKHCMGLPMPGVRLFGW